LVRSAIVIPGPIVVVVVVVVVLIGPLAVGSAFDAVFARAAVEAVIEVAAEAVVAVAAEEELNYGGRSD
jgi:hypothetical protein